MDLFFLWVLLLGLQQEQPKTQQGNNKSHHRYIACYKPALTLCTLKLETNRKAHKQARQTLANLNLPTNNTNNNLHIVGRLDRDSEGLLLLTTDGQFTAQTLSEGCHKRYWVKVKGTPSEESLERLRTNGSVLIRGKQTRPPVSVAVLSSSPPPSSVLPPPALGMDRPGTWLEIVLNEGRHRQVRKMTKSILGLETIRLVRMGIGGFHLLEDDHRDLLSKPGTHKDIEKELVSFAAAAAFFPKENDGE